VCEYAGEPGGIPGEGRGSSMQESSRGDLDAHAWPALGAIFNRELA